MIIISVSQFYAILIATLIKKVDRYDLYCEGDCISLTLKFFMSTSVAPSHLKVAIGPPHVINWSGSPPHSPPLLPQPPLSVFSSTFTHGPSSLSSSLSSTHISILTTVSPFCSSFHIMPLKPTHL